MANKEAIRLALTLYPERQDEEENLVIEWLNSLPRRPDGAFHREVLRKHMLRAMYQYALSRQGKGVAAPKVEVRQEVVPVQSSVPVGQPQVIKSMPGVSPTPASSSSGRRNPLANKIAKSMDGSGMTK